MAATYPRPVKRPKARWYLLSVPALLLALGFFVAGLVATVINAADTPRTRHGQITLVAGKKFDVFGATTPRDRVSCTFSPVSGGAGFTERFVVPRQHDSSGTGHHHYVRHRLGLDENLLGSFTAPRSGRFGLRCANAYNPINASADEAPPAHIYALFFAAAGLVIAAIGWTVFMIVRRSRSGRTALRAVMSQLG